MGTYDSEAQRAEAELVRQQYEVERQSSERSRFAAEQKRIEAEELRRGAVNELGATVAVVTALVERMELVEMMRRDASK